mgnify:CR=1 FL=1
MSRAPGRPSGAENKDKPFREALRLAIGDAKSNPKILRRIANSLLSLAADGDVSAIKEVADRLDGKCAQSVQMGGEDGGPIVVEIVRFAAKNQNSKRMDPAVVSATGVGLPGTGRQAGEHRLASPERKG